MENETLDQYFLKEAIKVSRQSIDIGGYPVGAIVVCDGEIIGRGISDGKNAFDATAHAEIIAIREASQQLQKRDLKNCIIYSSFEPCLMCFCASLWARISKIIYACPKEKFDSKHYIEGYNDLQLINENNIKKIEIVHMKELEDEAFAVVSDFEDNLKNKSRLIVDKVNT